jgi:succinyl-diaminopimelate desuccinylase
MKVSALVQAQVFRELAPSLPYPLALQLVADEEVGGRDGTLHQLEQGVTGTFVVIGEHSGLNLVADSKGVVQARLLAVGRSGHGAYPWLGDNALLKLVDTVTRLMTRYPVATEEAWRTTVNLARMDTPNRAFNQVPAQAEAWLDIRFPAEDADLDGRSPREVAEYLQTFCEPEVTAVVDRVESPHHADHDRSEVKELRRAAQAQGYPADFLYKHGGSDAGYYSGRGIAAVAFGVAGGGQHGPEEYAEISTIVPYHRALTGFLEHLRPTVGG